MERSLRVYMAVLRLVKLLPIDTRPYYAKYARANFVNYRDVDTSDAEALDELFNRTYVHVSWVLNKYSVDRSTADNLKDIPCN